MQILNEEVLRDLQQGVPLKLELGSGGKAGAGFYALDHLPLEGVDIIADLNQPLELLPDSCAAQIYSRHTLEHIENLLLLLAEVHRITCPGGRIEFIVPHFSNPYFYSDPTHVRAFGLYTMNYFVDPQHQPRRKVPAFYSSVRFTVQSIKIRFYRHSLLDHVVAPPLQWLVNRNFAWQNFYERRLASFFHAWEIVYVLTPVKQA